MITKIRWVSSIKIAAGNFKYYELFLQRMVNRICTGQLRYGEPKVEKMYMTRMIMEVKAYRKSGNAEQLINIANYAMLESMRPEHKNYHFDNNVKSVTR